MVFVDHAQLNVKAGDGGRGCSSLAQPPYTRTPYPDGGDGGDGGDVVVRTDPNVATLLDFQFRHEFKATRGRHGSSNNKSGKGGEDCVIRVPVGTVVQDAVSGAILGDLVGEDDAIIVAKGGRGGLGNASPPMRRLASRVRQQRGPRRPRTARKTITAADAQPGQPGEQRRLSLELKLIADVGIVGLPNAGKSSLLTRISTARPKIGAYPFTTRYPVLGVVRVDALRTFVACDIPGLIEGAHAGKGLGMEFLRHIERTRLLIHVIDMAALDGRDPIAMYAALNRELDSYSPALRHRPQLIAVNKMDLPQAREHLARFRAKLSAPVYEISCATNVGMPQLIEAAWRQLQQAPRPEPVTDGSAVSHG